MKDLFSRFMVLAALFLSVSAAAQGVYFERCVPVRKASAGEEDRAYDLIVRIAARFRVPPGLLYGIWRKESQALLCGWKTADPNWFRASELSKRGGECLRRYAHKPRDWCNVKFSALKAVCSQRYKSGPWRGKRVCDPEHVFTSYAHAMGPMQIMPTEIVEWKNGRWQMSKYAVDANGDGAVDPHDLVDALSVTARKFAAHAGENDNWKRAANRYYGSSREFYWEGRWEWSERREKIRYRKGILDYWRIWCNEIMPCAKRH